MSPTQPTFKRERPNALLRFAFKVPPLIYRGPIAEFLSSRCVLRLTTTGRKSGQPRTISVSYMRADEGIIIFSGFGVDSNWYQNVLANPQVTVEVGRQKRTATATVVDDPDRRQELMLQMQEQSKSCGPPTFIRPLLRLTRTFDYDAEIELAVDNARELPLVLIEPDTPL